MGKQRVGKFIFGALLCAFVALGVGVAANPATVQAAQYQVNNLRFINTSATGTRVQWDKFSGATGYKVESKPDTTSAWTVNNANFTSSDSKPQYRFATKPGTRYSFRITPIVPGNSYVYAKTVSDYTYPTKVTNLQKGSYIYLKEISLQWKSSAAVDGYVITLQNAKGQSKTIETRSSYNSIAASSVMFYKVTIKPYVVYEGSTKRIYGTPLTTYTSIQPKLSINRASATAKSAKISWTKVLGATNYTVYYSSTRDGAYKNAGTVTGTSKTITNLVPKRKYYYRVVANKKVGSTVYKGPSEYVFSSLY
ncbi:MAG: fibronectin type III domain-containing protein [Lachnospiraceae bacterium]